MKKIVPSLALMFLLVFIQSCSSTKKTSNETQKKEVILNVNATNIPDQIAFLKDSKKKTFVIKKIKDGHFADTLDLSKGFYEINIGKEYSDVYLKPGMNLEISVDGNQFDESIQYKGKGAMINNYLAKDMLINEKDKKLYPPTKIVTLSEKDFLRVADSLYNQNINRLKESGITDKEFISLQSKKYLVDKNTMISMYPIYMSYFMKKPYKTSPDFPKPLAGLDIKDSTLIEIPGYINLVESFVSSKADPALMKKDYMLALIKSAETNLASVPQLKEKVIIDLAKQGISDTKKLKEFYQVFSNNVKDPEAKKEMETKYQNLLKLQPGYPSPDFTAYDINGKEYHLADFKGKNVYIDLWATWCAPCRAEIPFLEKLKEDYKGKNIEFLSIDVYDDKGKWENMVKSGKISGTQLIIPEREAEFLKLYNVNGIPRFIFIDKDGKIIDNNVSRPSNPATRELLDKYIAE